MGRSMKKGPFVEERLMKRIESMNTSGSKTHGQDLVADLDDLPGDGRPHDRRPRRPEAHPRVRDRADGRPQAGRVRADAALPRPFRRPPDAGEEGLVSDSGDHRDTRSARPGQVGADVRPQGAARRGAHPRPQRARGAGGPRLHAPRRGPRDGEGAESAVANAEANHGLYGEDLIVSAAYVDEGPTLKRWRARARGRVARIRKRTCHITVTLAPAPSSATAAKGRRGASEQAAEEDEAPPVGAPTKADEPASRSPRRRPRPRPRR